MMDHEKQMLQTETIIVEMLEFLETSSEEECDLDQKISEKCHEKIKIMNKDFNDNIFIDKIKSKKISNHELKKEPRLSSTIAKELKKLRDQLKCDTTNEIDFNNKNQINYLKTQESLNKSVHQNDIDISSASDYEIPEWIKKLENQCRRSSGNSFIQEIHKAIYQETAGHPSGGSADYYQAAQNYALYGKNFLDFPDNLEAIMGDKNLQNSTMESTNLIQNFGNCLYTKPNSATSNTIAPTSGGFTSAAAYYQICNSMQTQARPALSNNPVNSTAYGIFLGNKVTYIAATPQTPSLICNQHSTTTTNFVSNSLANAALATSPTILYTNPMLTTTTQQYLTQFLNTAASIQSPTAASNVAASSVYERLIYAQMLQQQLYQTQQAAAIAAMFQHKQRVAAAAAAARQSVNGLVVNTNRSSPQHLTTTPTTSSGNISTFCNSNPQVNSSPAEFAEMKQQNSAAVVATIVAKIENSKSKAD